MIDYRVFLLTVTEFHTDKAESCKAHLCIRAAAKVGIQYFGLLSVGICDRIKY